MKIILTGATGFIGQYVYKRLLNTTHQVIVISRKPSLQENWHQVDILNEPKLNEFISTTKADCLIHLAWDVTHGAFWTAPNNEQYAAASKSLFNCFVKNGGKKIIAAGTCAEYATSNLEMHENTLSTSMLTPYGQAKRSVFDFLNAAQEELDFAFTWFRIFGVFGPGENPARFIPQVIHAISNQETYEIKNPNIFTDYVFVDDLATFIVACIDNDIHGPINIGTGKPMSLADLYLTIKNYMSTGHYKMFETITAQDPGSRIPCCKKLHGHGFNFSFEPGLNATIQDFIGIT